MRPALEVLLVMIWPLEDACCCRLEKDLCQIHFFTIVLCIFSCDMTFPCTMPTVVKVVTIVGWALQLLSPPCCSPGLVHIFLPSWGTTCGHASFQFQITRQITKRNQAGKGSGKVKLPFFSFTHKTLAESSRLWYFWWYNMKFTKFLAAFLEVDGWGGCKFRIFTGRGSFLIQQGPPSRHQRYNSMPIFNIEVR